MKSEGCGDEFASDAGSCAACGRPMSSGQRVGVETVRVAEKTGEVAEKMGRGRVAGV